MRKWLMVLVALASFGAGWIVNDLTDTTECSATTTRIPGAPDLICE